jgi:hypothetical protein
MTWAILLEFGLRIFEGIARETKYTGDDKLAKELLAALEAFRKVRGTPVTRAQVQSLKVSKE